PSLIPGFRDTLATPRGYNRIGIIGTSSRGRSMFHPRRLACLMWLSCWLTVGLLKGDEPAAPDLTDYKTVENAATTRLSRAAPDKRQPGYLGIFITADEGGRAVIKEVDPASPAAKAGLKAGDRIQSLDGKAVNAAALHEALANKYAGDKL